MSPKVVAMNNFFAKRFDEFKKKKKIWRRNYFDANDFLVKYIIQQQNSFIAKCILFYFFLKPYLETNYFVAKIIF